MQSLRHKRVLQIENEILTNISPNESWMPLLNWIYTPITLAKLRHLLQHISVFKIKKRDDHLYGATRYLANSLGIYICDTNMSDLVDQPMTPVGKKQVWRLATFHCRCINKVNLHTFQARTFCKTCTFLVLKDNMSTFNEVCPFCHINESWKEIGHPCLACQVATIIYRNPFHLRFQNCIRLWLHLEDSEDNISTAPYRPTSSHTNLSVQDMIRKRNLSFEHSFQEIKSKATPEQRKYIFENLSELQNNFQSNHTRSKRDHPIQEYADDITSVKEETMSPKKRSTNSRTVLQDKSIGSNTTDTITSSPIPLAAMDINLIHSESVKNDLILEFGSCLNGIELDGRKRGIIIMTL